VRPEPVQADVARDRLDAELHPDGKRSLGYARPEATLVPVNVLTWSLVGVGALLLLYEQRLLPARHARVAEQPAAEDDAVGDEAGERGRSHVCRR
jgi:hypothetical protein